MCHPKGRSAAKDARSALTRRPARSYSAPTIPATVRYARRRSGERHERSIPRPPALPAPLADPPIAPQPTHTRLRRAECSSRAPQRRLGKERGTQVLRGILTDCPQLGNGDRRGSDGRSPPSRPAAAHARGRPPRRGGSLGYPPWRGCAGAPGGRQVLSHPVLPGSARPGLCCRGGPDVKATPQPERCVRPAPAADAGRRTVHRSVGAGAPDHAGHAPRPAATPASPGAWRVRSRWSRGRHAPSPPRPLKSSGRGAAGLPSGTVVPTAPPTPEKTTMASNTEKTSPPAFGEGLATHRHLPRPGARPPGPSAPGLCGTPRRVARPRR